MLFHVKLFFKMLKETKYDAVRHVNEISRASPVTDYINCAEQ